MTTTGALKRQAARFRIYGYNAQGEAVAELTADLAEVRWTVHLANKKSAWYQFQLALDVPEAGSTPPTELRNKNVPDRAKLVIDPGPRSIEGPDRSGPEFQFASGAFFGTPVYLGELRTDEAGRLIVFGGRGVSASVDGAPATTFANNDGWHDDVADGPVTAEVRVDGRTIPVEAAWVVVAPPNYAPDIVGVRTLHDLLLDTFVRDGRLPFPTPVSFTRHVLPILRRLVDHQWVNAGFASQFGWGGPNQFLDPEYVDRLAAAGPAHEELRRQIYNSFREFDRDGYAPGPWPWLYGDAMDVPPVKSPRQHVALSMTQLRTLQLWAEGRFVADYDPGAEPPRTLDAVPLARRPEMLDRAALEFCLADAFHPGCELTWPMRHSTLYAAPFRIRHRPAGEPAPDFGSQLTPEVALSAGGPLHAQGPGDLTRWMAVPWQTDTASCRSGYYAGFGPRYDPFLPTFWPARVPNHVLTFDDYETILNTTEPREGRLDAFRRRAVFFRGLGTGGYQQQINTMIRDFGKLGVVETRPGVPDDPDFPPVMRVESTPGFAAGILDRANGLIVIHAPEAGADLEASGSVAAAAAQAGVAEDQVVIGPIEKVRRFPNGLKAN